MIVELSPVVDKETFLTYLKYFAVEQDDLVPENSTTNCWSIELRRIHPKQPERMRIGSMPEIVAWTDLILYSVYGRALPHEELVYKVRRLYFILQNQNVASFYHAFQISLHFPFLDSTA